MDMDADAGGDGLTAGIPPGRSGRGKHGAPGVARESKRSDVAAHLRGVVEEVLQETGYSDARAAKLDIDDFLALLKAFADRNIRFS